MTISGMIKRLENFNVLNEVIKICNDHKEVLAEANKMQWRLGQNSEGDKLVPYQYASKKYARAKFDMNNLPGQGNMDLILTGKTVKSIKTDIVSEALRFQLTSDIHELEQRYGSEILGLSPESKKAFIETYLLPELIQSFYATK